MQYMFLIYLNESKFAGMTQSQRDAFGNGMLDYDDTLKGSGHYIRESLRRRRPKP